MSDAFILRSGGGSGISEKYAVIHVRAEAGSTIKFSKVGLDQSEIDVKVLGPEKSHATVDDPLFADWYFSVRASNYGEWKIYATKDNETVSSSVIISEVKQYDIFLLFNLYIIKNGVIKYSNYGTYSSISIAQHSDTVGFTFSGTECAFYVKLDNNFLNSIRYRKLIVDFESVSKSDYVYWGIRSIYTGNYGNGWYSGAYQTASSSIVLPFHGEYDISKISYFNQYFDFTIRYPTLYAEVTNIYFAR